MTVTLTKRIQCRGLPTRKMNGNNTVYSKKILGVVNMGAAIASKDRVTKI